MLAPLADVTDASFRRVIAKNGKPDVTWTEFVSADGLMRATPEGKQKLLADLIYTDAERPIVAQLFSANEEHMEAAAKLCRELGFDGIDINMGCPDRGIERQGCGSAMIKNPPVAQAIVRAAKRGAGSDEGGIPVSVKTRLGYNHDELEEWLPAILEVQPAALTVHARTRKEMSKVPARWERVARAVELRDELGSETLIIGNGDALSLEDARVKAELSRADGVMLGRAIFGNPWLFNPNKRLPEHDPSSRVSPTLATTPQTDSTLSVVGIEERLLVMLEHTRLFAELLPHKNFALMKKHYKAYVSGFMGATELRTELMNAPDVAAIESIVHTYLRSIS